MGWLSRVEFDARKQKVETFSSKKSEALISELKTIFFEDEKIEEKSKKALNEAGIKFVVLKERPEQTPVDGVAFWSNKNPVIGMTRRYNRLDNFAFTLFHELGHVYLHEARIKAPLNVDMVDNLEDYLYNNTKEEEKQANDFASHNLIAKEKWEKFNLEHYEFSDNEIQEFANEMGIHPAIVVGRLRHDNPTLYRRRFRVSNEIND